jgi:hypothetical protein
MLFSMRIAYAVRDNSSTNSAAVASLGQCGAFQSMPQFQHRDAAKQKARTLSGLLRC